MEPPEPQQETRRFHPYSPGYVGDRIDVKQKQAIFGPGFGGCSFPGDGKSPVLVHVKNPKAYVLDEDEGTSMKWVLPPSRVNQGKLHHLVDGTDTVRLLVRPRPNVWYDRGEYYVTGIDMEEHPYPVDSKGRFRENRRFLLRKKEDFLWIPPTPTP